MKQEYLVKILFAVFLTCFTLTVSNRIVAAQEITIQIRNLKHKTGNIMVALFRDKDTWLDDSQTAYQGIFPLSLRTDSSEVHFNNIQPGYYAMAVFLDENKNGKMDMNFIGIPKEPYGFSNNPAVLFRAPTFKEASIDITQQAHNRFVINLKKPF